jgi:hypothetical protein
MQHRGWKSDKFFETVMSLGDLTRDEIDVEI